jgi:hypothetical protein
MNTDRIVRWNRDRGLMKTFNPNLEAKMLTEEAREFFLASEVEHMLQEAADFMFVKTGTVAKYFAQESEGVQKLLSDYDHFNHMFEWMRDTIDCMVDVLTSKYIACGFPTIQLESDLELALSFVCNANDAKGKEKVDGKVVKGKYYIDPIEQIRDYLKEEYGYRA